MRDHDDVPYIVIEREGGGGGIGSFILGALVGAGFALLFAPKSGEETQEDLKAQALKFKGSAQDRIRETQATFESSLTAARENVHARVENVKEAVESGRQAAIEAREDLGKKLEHSKAAYRAGIEAARGAVGDEEEDSGDLDSEETTEE